MSNRDGMSKPPKTTEDMVNGLRKFQAEQSARDAGNPNYDYMPSSYISRCEEWAMLDFWTLSEAANLLAGTDPMRPAIPGHKVLNDKVKRISNWLKNSTVKKEGILPKRYVSKEVITWAIEKKIDVPAPLLEIMGHKPKSAEKSSEHGNAVQNAKKREKVLGAAVRAIALYPAQCRGNGEKYTGTSIARYLEQKQDTFFEGEVAPYSVQGMANVINSYLSLPTK